MMCKNYISSELLLDIKVHQRSRGSISDVLARLSEERAE